jgi:von Willebrand factor type A domain
MSFSLGAPEWLFLAPALAVLGWRVPGLRLREPLRVLALAALVLALADPRWSRGGGGLDLWVLVDHSDSAAAGMATRRNELEAILEKSKGREDRVFYVDYAVDAVRREQGDPVFRGGTHETRMANALEFTLGQLDADRAARLLAIGDGYPTGPLDDAAEQVLRRGVPLDYRLVGESSETDLRVEALDVPNRVLPGEAFLVEFSVVGHGDADVPWEVTRDGKMAAHGIAKLREGAARVRLTDRMSGGGAVRYEARIRPLADEHTENNAAAAWIEVAGGARVLLITNYPDDPLAALLGAQGLAVTVVTNAMALAPAALTGTRLVVLNNVPAHRVATEFLAALDFYVREQGGGLLMVGGENSFGSGGYFSSAVDPLLPVSMELRKEHRKLATAMAIVLDRSGSMAASAGGGLTKMDLANSGTARAIELLGNYDAVSVQAVDSAPHEIVGLAQVGPNRQRMLDSVRRIVSTGGGIYVEAGLRAGWEELKKAETGQRHLVLLSDANDSEEPGKYIELIDEMRAAGATVSVIGLGTPADQDAALLEDIAKRGGGRMFFNENAGDLPAIFAQETVSVARSAFIKEPTVAQGTPGWSEISARSPEWLSSVDGYNLSYLRPGATAALVTTDEYQAPLVATWARGAGRVGAVSFPLGGGFSNKARSWAGYGDFTQTLGRWLAGENVPPGLAVRTEMTDGQLRVDLLYDESWSARVAQNPPEAVLSVTGGRGGVDIEGRTPMAWEKLEKGRFRAVVDVPVGKGIRGAVRVGGASVAFGPVVAAGAAEWSYDRKSQSDLRQLSARSGGVERLDLASIWTAQRKSTGRSLRQYMTLFLSVIVFIEALMLRIGLAIPGGLPHRSKRRG